MDEHPATERTHWVGRPVLTHVVRAVAIAIPILVGVTAGWLAGSLLPKSTGWAELGWWAAVLAAATTGMIAAEALARRLLPLSVLLRLTLAFPDHAPSRLRVALRATSVRRMSARVSSEEHGALPPAERAVELVALAAALNAHDRRTRGHSQRVQALTGLVAEQMNLSSEERDRVMWAAFLHDIGKLVVPSAILNKAGAPSRAEWKVLRRHPEEGARLAAPLEPWLGESIGAIGEHHEHFDGTGYPSGVSGAEISLAGRIVAVTDAFETITAVRSYKRPQNFEHARAEITRCAGTQFDPHVVRALLSVSLGRLRWVIGVASWLALVPLLGAIPRAHAAVSGTATTGAAGALAGASVATLLLATPPGGVVPGSSAEASQPGEPATQPSDEPSPNPPAPDPLPLEVPVAASGTADDAGSDAVRVHARRSDTRGNSPAEPPTPGVEVTVRAGPAQVAAGPGGAEVTSQDPPSEPSITVQTPGQTFQVP